MPKGGPCQFQELLERATITKETKHSRAGLSLAKVFGDLVMAFHGEGNRGQNVWVLENKDHSQIT